MTIVIKSCFYGTLLWNAIHDMKTKEWSDYAMILFLIGGIGACILRGATIADIARALFPGGFILASSVLLKGQIGLGDGLIICVGGLYLSGQELWNWILLAFGISGVFGVFLICIRKYKSSERIAFIPFLFLAAVLEKWI